MFVMHIIDSIYSEFDQVWPRSDSHYSKCFALFKLFRHKNKYLLYIFLQIFNNKHEESNERKRKGLFLKAV